MHVGDIGHPFMPTSSGIIDQLVVNWPGYDGFAAYRHLAKWVAQDPTGVYSNAVENADNYASMILAPGYSPVLATSRLTDIWQCLSRLTMYKSS